MLAFLDWWWGSDEAAPYGGGNASTEAATRHAFLPPLPYRVLTVLLTTKEMLC